MSNQKGVDRSTRQGLRASEAPDPQACRLQSVKRHVVHRKKHCAKHQDLPVPLHDKNRQGHKNAEGYSSCPRQQISSAGHPSQDRIGNESGAGRCRPQCLQRM